MVNFKSVNRAEMKIVGITVRTDNKSEVSGSGKIGPLWQRFIQEGISEKIPNQVSAGTVFPFTRITKLMRQGLIPLRLAAR